MSVIPENLKRLEIEYSCIPVTQDYTSRMEIVYSEFTFVEFKRLAIILQTFLVLDRVGKVTTKLHNLY